MSLLLVFFFLVSLLGAALWFLYIPLPPALGDRRKLYFIELLNRLLNDYMGDFIEPFIGPVYRNMFTRFAMAFAYYLPWPKDQSVEVSTIYLRGVRTRLLRPKDVSKRSDTAIIYIHGGGWATMRPEYYDFVVAYFVRKLNCSIFAIDYRLSPEHPYPAAINDCEDVIKALFHDGKLAQYGVNEGRVAVMGDSAGGNLSAVISRRLRETKEIKCQVLIYPVTSVFAFCLPSYQEYLNEYPGTGLLSPYSAARWMLFYMGGAGRADQVEKMVKCLHIPKGANSHLDEMVHNADKANKTSFMQAETDEDLTALFTSKGLNPDISPLHAEDLSGIPPTMVVTAGTDVLRDEGDLYADRLAAAGVVVDKKHYPQAYHGVLNMPYSRTKASIHRDIVAFLSQNL